MKARIAVIGAGPWGKNHVRNFHTLGVLASVCDSSAATLSAIAKTYAVQTTPDVRALAEDQAIDAVVVATPAATHGALVREFLQAGKHVFVEKPLCLDTAEARDLARLARDRGKVLMVGHLLQYHPAFRALMDAVAAGAIGKLRYIYSNRASLGRIRTEESALWSFAPHDVSMILALAGRMPERVVATGANYVTDGVADTTLSHLTFSDDLQAHIFVSWLHPYKDHRTVVIGSQGMIVFNDVGEGAQKLLLYPHALAKRDGIPVVTKAEAKPIPYGSEEPLSLECAHFLDCVTTGARPITDADEGVRVLAVLQACERSITSGAAVGAEALRG